MRIHSDLLFITDLDRAMENAEHKAPNVTLHVIGSHSSRSHKKAYEVALRGHGARHTRPPNTGFRGGPSTGERAASRDDWGWFMAEVFARDPGAWFGPYKTYNGFHRATDGKYHVSMGGFQH